MRRLVPPSSFAACAAVVFLGACGSGDGSGDGASPDGSGGRPSATAPGASSKVDPSSVDAGAADFVGVWTVEGKDARGVYQGQAEVREEAGRLRVIRAIRYSNVTVENGRELHWAFIGDGARERGALTVKVVLENRDYLRARNGIERKLSDVPIPVTATITLEGNLAKATWQGSTVDGVETWSARAPSAASPIVSVNRTVVDAHDAPSALEKGALFSTYASYHALPTLQPYVQRPEFQAAVHGHVIDKTDADFYRVNKNALRVINKTIDEISLGETLSRANAYRASMAEKAASFDAEVESDFLDPQTGMLYDGFAPGKTAKEAHFSAALWTGVYAASQALRWEVTQDPKAKANFLLSLDGILKLQEVTGDWKVFARAIRPAGTGTPSAQWKAGAGPHANLEWLSGGNNDMTKGLYLAYVVGYRMLCKGPGYESLCSRIRTNSRHFADDVNVSLGSGEIDSPWLAAAVTDNDAIAKLTYQAKAEAAWVVGKPILANNTMVYAQGTADWSGLHLHFATNLFHMLLADLYDLGGDSRATFKKIIDDLWSSVHRQRLPLWNVLHAAYGTKGALDTAALDDATWRLREFPFPKSMQLVDHSVSPDFSLSPYPSLPWKNDWTTNAGRIQSLRTYPLFEDSMDVYRFRTEMIYRGDTTLRFAAPEYLIGYWLARKHGLVSATD